MSLEPQLEVRLPMQTYSSVGPAQIDPENLGRFSSIGEGCFYHHNEPCTQFRNTIWK